MKRLNESQETLNNRPAWYIWNEFKKGHLTMSELLKYENANKGRFTSKGNWINL